MYTAYVIPQGSTHTGRNPIHNLVSKNATDDCTAAVPPAPPTHPPIKVQANPPVSQRLSSKLTLFECHSSTALANTAINFNPIHAAHWRS